MSDETQTMPNGAAPALAPASAPGLNGEAKQADPRPTAAPPVGGQPAATQQAGAGAQQRLRFNTSNIKSSYCNVCNATSTREEVVINFGLNQTWDMGTQDLEVQLEHRIILSPSAAKRLQELLTRLMQEHEQRYGALR